MRLVARPRNAVADITIALGAHALEFDGRDMPVLPRSTIREGRWAGVDVDIEIRRIRCADLRTLLKDNQLIFERHDI